jgi:hypothetical protein
VVLELAVGDLDGCELFDMVGLADEVGVKDELRVAIELRELDREIMELHEPDGLAVSEREERGVRLRGWP